MSATTTSVAIAGAAGRMGRMLLNSIHQRDYALVQGTVLFIAFNFVLINLLADVLYTFANPRIRYE